MLRRGVASDGRVVNKVTREMANTSPANFVVHEIVGSSSTTGAVVASVVDANGASVKYRFGIFWVHATHKGRPYINNVVRIA